LAREARALVGDDRILVLLHEGVVVLERLQDLASENHVRYSASQVAKILSGCINPEEGLIPLGGESSQPLGI
jgi:hypothetical protein